jgi:outer membrane protein assembly factor BamA
MPNDRIAITRLAPVLRRSAFLLALAAMPASAQEQSSDVPQTREEVLAAERADKVAELWPERQNAMVDIANGLVERGLSEGLDSGKGANGLQLVLGGMRSGQGMSGGLGYRRSDLFRDQVGIRGTARGTVRGAYMLDAEVDFQGFRTDRTFLRWYTRYEHSPQIDYFGQGNNSSDANRTSYRYDDFSSDLNASFALTPRVHLGATGGYFDTHTAPSGEDGVPPIDEAFSPDTLPGLGKDTNYTRIGFFAYYDSRDSLTGPRRGGLFVARYREYWDVGRKQFAFRQTEFEAQKFVPYFNGGRVLAFRASVVLSFPKADGSVPIYLQPTLGGSDELRGFVPYRFKDYHSINLTAEHRWHAFSLLDMALFADAGKVVPVKRDLDVSRLHYSGGIGFRLRLHSAIVSRIDLAGSSEGLRMIWTFSDIFHPNF